MAIQLNEKNVFTQVHLILKHFLKEGKKNHNNKMGMQYTTEKRNRI